ASQDAFSAPGLSSSYCFFFQAEDGIRDFHVTGVQTCALPISDAFFRKIIRAPEFQHAMSTAEFHHLCGKYVAERQRALGQTDTSLLAVCHEYDVPIYTSSPGEIGRASCRDRGQRHGGALTVPT